MGDGPEFKALGSCEITNTAESLSCTTFKGGLIVAYAAQQPIATEEQVIATSLSSIKSHLEKENVIQPFIDELKSSSGITITSMSYGGPEIPAVPVGQDLVISGSLTGANTASDEGGLNNLGKGMTAFVGLLGLVVLVLFCCLFRARLCSGCRKAQREKDCQESPYFTDDESVGDAGKEGDEDLGKSLPKTPNEPKEHKCASPFCPLCGHLSKPVYHTGDEEEASGRRSLWGRNPFRGGSEYVDPEDREAQRKMQEVEKSLAAHSTSAEPSVRFVRVNTRDDYTRLKSVSYREVRTHGNK
jgi:hypothetical protein